MNKKGFTLIELLVVISIIGTLSTIIIGSLGSARDRVKITKYRTEMQTIEKVFQMALLDEDRDTWWNENNFPDPDTINHIRSISSGPGKSISKYLPSKNWVDPFSGGAYRYDSDGDSNDSCTHLDKGVNIYTVIVGHNDLKEKIDKQIDGEINASCGKIKYDFLSLIYEISPNPHDL